jgi:hypothetical protein
MYLTCSCGYLVSPLSIQLPLTPFSPHPVALPQKLVHDYGKATRNETWQLVRKEEASPRSQFAFPSWYLATTDDVTLLQQVMTPKY